MKKSTPQSVGLRNRKNGNIELVLLFSNPSLTKPPTFKSLGHFFRNFEKLEGVDKVPWHLLGVLGLLCLFSKSVQIFHMVLVIYFFWFCFRNITYNFLKVNFQEINIRQWSARYNFLKNSQSHPHFQCHMGWHCLSFQIVS